MDSDWPGAWAALSDLYPGPGVLPQILGGSDVSDAESCWRQTM